MSKGRLLVIHTHTDFRDLLAIALGEEGYEVETTADLIGVFDQLKQRWPQERPALLLLEIRSDFPPSVELLDCLRTDPDLGALPVLVLATLEGDAILAEASFNVYGAIRLPFDLDHLCAAVDQTLRLQRLPPPPSPAELGPGVVAAASEVLVREQRNIVLRWLQRVAAEGIFPKPVPVNERLGKLALLFRALLATWHPGAPPLEELLQPGTDFWYAVDEHVRLRRQMGATAADIARSYAILLAEIWRSFQEQLPHLSGQEVYLLSERVNRTLGKLLSIALRVYDEQERAEPK